MKDQTPGDVESVNHVESHAYIEGYADQQFGPHEKYDQPEQIGFGVHDEDGLIHVVPLTQVAVYVQLYAGLVLLNVTVAQGDVCVQDAEHPAPHHAGPPGEQSGQL